MNDDAPRILSIDDNIRSIGGHYLELATQLGTGAAELGYRFELAAHESLDTSTLPPGSAIPLTKFRSHRTVYWSLGVDGQSSIRKNGDGECVEGRFRSRCWHWIRESLSRYDRRPDRMIRRWADDFQSLVEHWQPRPEDMILINTADDFLMLALSRAMRRMKRMAPLDVRVIFHFAVFEHERATERSRMFGRQVNQVLSEIAPHRVSLYGTTTGLVRQLDRVGVVAQAVPYPTRLREPINHPNAHRDAVRQTLKLVLAGMPRREKGRNSLVRMLTLIQPQLIPGGPFRVSMQLPPVQWKKMIPRSLHHTATVSENGDVDTTSALEVMTGYLSADTYHDWLDTADVGVFLYDSDRYQARCSGVLLEMLVRGIPVIVPDQCWLSEQIEAAGGDGSVGYIYKTVDEFPQLLAQIKLEYDQVRERAIAYASVIARRHTGSMTLRTMGIAPIDVAARRAA